MTASRNYQLFQDKCKVLNLVQSNPKHQCQLESEWMESLSELKNLGELVD